MFTGPETIGENNDLSKYPSESEIGLGVLSDISAAVGNTIEDHSTLPSENEGTSKEIVDNALNDVG